MRVRARQRAFMVNTRQQSFAVTVAVETC